MSGFFLSIPVKRKNEKKKKEKSYLSKYAECIFKLHQFLSGKLLFWKIKLCMQYRSNLMPLPRFCWELQLLPISTALFCYTMLVAMQKWPMCHTTSYNYIKELYVYFSVISFPELLNKIFFYYLSSLTCCAEFYNFTPFRHNIITINLFWGSLYCYRILSSWAQKPVPTDSHWQGNSFCH